MSKEKTDSELLHEIHECLVGTLEKRGLVRRVEILEWWKRVSMSTILSVIGIFGAGVAGYITYRMIGN